MGASAEPVQRAAASAASATDPFGDRSALHGFGLRSFGQRSNAVLRFSSRMESHHPYDLGVPKLSHDEGGLVCLTQRRIPQPPGFG